MKRIALSLLLLTIPCLLHAGEIRNYDWLTNGAVSGSLVMTVIDGQHREIKFEFNDRGRGPELFEQIRLDETGNLLELTISGHSYMGAPANEHFLSEGTTARWSSTIEKGESSHAEDAMYLASDGSIEQLAMLVRRALKAADHSVKLLPAGKAVIRALEQIEVSQGGKTRKVRLYEISGLDLGPDYIWLDEDLEMFAVAYGWMGMAPRGWTEVLPALQTAIDKAENAYHERLAAKLTRSIEGRYAVSNVRVLDVEQGTLLPDRTVVVENGVILSVSTGQPSDSVGTMIDGNNGILMPGLWDMHTHLDPGSGLLHIAAGVTTTRDLGNNPDRLDEVRGMFDDGSVIGPRSFAAGFIDRKSPYAAPIDRLVDSREEALQLVRDYAARGYPQIKIYSSIDPDWVVDIANEVHRLDMRLSGHIPSFMTTEQAVRDGFNEIQHINMLFLNFLAGPEDDTRTPVRFSLVADKAGSLDLDSEQVTAFIGLLRDNKVVVDPTVAIFDNMFRHRSGELSPSFAMVAGHMPPSVRRGFLAGTMDINDENATRYSASAEALLELIRRLHKAGIPLVAGTDSLAGFGLHRELELYVQAGIPERDVLRLATLGSAEIMSAADSSGSIVAGKKADMVLLPNNPLEDINAVRKAKMVFKGNRVWEPSRLYRAVGIKPFL
jgi:hypothetical protein